MRSEMFLPCPEQYIQMAMTGQNAECLLQKLGYSRNLCSASAPASIHRCSQNGCKWKMCKIIRTKDCCIWNRGEKSAQWYSAFCRMKKRDHTGDEKVKIRFVFNNSRAFCILPAAAPWQRIGDRASSIPAQDREIPKCIDRKRQADTAHIFFAKGMTPKKCDRKIP